MAIQTPDLNLTKPLAQQAFHKIFRTLGISSLNVLREIVKPGY